jgi:hypothetical protein
VDHFVVAFAERPATAADRNARAPPEPASDGLERELATTREQLRATIDALESANEEMESSNEEYQLQSTNEELETSKEEMQSINEELQTVNAELNSKNDQLTRTVSDPMTPRRPQNHRPRLPALALFGPRPPVHVVGSSFPGRVDEDVAILIPHRSGCAGFPRPVLHGRVSLAKV